MKKASIIIFVVILLGVVIYALYSNTRRNVLGSDNTNLTISITSKQEENKNIDSQNKDALASENINPEIRSLVFYLDKNINGVQDTDEKTCNLCSGGQVLSANTSQDGSMPKVDNIKLANISIDGSIKEDVLDGSNTVWGVFEGKNIIFPVSNFSFGDGAQSNVRAIEYTAKIAGVNANIITTERSGSSSVYSMSSLIPPFLTAFTNGKAIYMKYSATTDGSKYYIATSKITNNDGIYSLEAEWGVDPSLESGALNASNLTFYIL